ncbi:DUF4625 domain-containing protein [Pedobacter sp. AW1-32]|uniref:DUF4625 domain-containing protein n=1 Tax=Pedobacter sp. AW1-32 TaxID=3383026 RepID=UPI003FEF3AEE
MKIRKIIFMLAIFGTAFTACKKETDEVKTLSPTADNIEIGSANSKIGRRGQDFHFNANVVAVSTIRTVQLRIAQKSSQSYSRVWNLELNWPDYTGLKNANVHKHLTIPSEAPIGLYDFYFMVTDENGSQLNIREDFTIADPQ